MLITNRDLTYVAKDIQNQRMLRNIPLPRRWRGLLASKVSQICQERKRLGRRLEDPAIATTNHAIPHNQEKWCTPNRWDLFGE